MERERKVWNEHRELIVADERARFEQEKAQAVHHLQVQLSVERERCETLEKKLHDAQTVVEGVAPPALDRHVLV